MSRIALIPEQSAPPAVAQLYSEIRKNMGGVPNIFLAMGNSPAVLKGYLGLHSAQQESSLPLRLREKIALAVGEINRCRYCLAAHSVLAAQAGLSEEEVADARAGEDGDPKNQAILLFVRRAVENRGWVSNAQVIELREAGVSDQEISEIVLSIAVNMFTNYFNHIVDPEVDFPAAKDL